MSGKQVCKVATTLQRFAVISLWMQWSDQHFDVFRQVVLLHFYFYYFNPVQFRFSMKIWFPFGTEISIFHQFCWTDEQGVSPFFVFWMWPELFSKRCLLSAVELPFILLLLCMLVTFHILEIALDANKSTCGSALRILKVTRKFKVTYDKSEPLLLIHIIVFRGVGFLIFFFY